MLVNQILSDFLQNGPSDEEVSKAKTSIIDNFPTQLQSNWDILKTVISIVSINCH